MRQHAETYAAQIVRNAQALGKALEDEGIAVEARDFGYTRSHQIAVNVGSFGGGVPVAQQQAWADQLLALNGISSTGLQVGQVLQLPKTQ